MSCELKYRFTSLLCKTVKNNMQSLQGTDSSFFVRISFLCLKYFLLTATSRRNDSNEELKGFLMFHLSFGLFGLGDYYKSHMCLDAFSSL